MAAPSPALAPVPTCGRAGCQCPHDVCDHGWLDGFVGGAPAAVPCPLCRPERQVTGWTTATNRAAWLAAGNARLREVPRQRRRTA